MFYHIIKSSSTKFSCTISIITLVGCEYDYDNVGM